MIHPTLIAIHKTISRLEMSKTAFAEELYQQIHGKKEMPQQWAKQVYRWLDIRRVGFRGKKGEQWVAGKTGGYTPRKETLKEMAAWLEEKGE